MAVELASAYVSIIPTTKGLQSNLEKELSPLTGAAAKAGNDSGKALGSSFSGASGGLKSSLGEAEGHFGKFKTGAVSALGEVGISSGMLATVGVASVVAFGVKSLEAFEHTAIAARDLSVATGLTVEDASRWIGVAKDMNVNADGLTAGLGKIAKTIDSSKWAQYGIDTRDAGGEALSVNDILLATSDKLAGVDNEAQKAAIGNDLFGKGFKTIAPLMAMGREELTKYLDKVEKGQVITEGELSTAEKSEQAQKKLKQAMGELGLTAGQLLAKLAPVLEVIAKTVGVVADLANAYVDLLFATKSTDKEQGALTKSIDAGTIGAGNAVQQFGELVKAHFNAQSGIEKTSGFFGRLTGIVDGGDESFRQFRNTFIGVAEESPAAAQKILDGYVAIKAAADAGDAAAQQTIHSNGLQGDSLTNLQHVVDSYTTDQKNGIQTTAQQKQAIDDVKAATDADAAATEAHQKAIDDNNKALQAEADLLNTAVEALHAQASAFRAAADHTYAVSAASDAYEKHLSGLKQTIKDAKGNQDEINAAYREGSNLAAAHADAVVTLAQDNATAMGITVTATQAQDTWNASMLDAANEAGPAERAEILRYIGQANGIPAEKVTEIQALVDAGKIEEAKQVLADASVARTVDVTADAKTAQATADLNNLTKPREITIIPFLPGHNPLPNKWLLNPGQAGGTSNAPAGLTPVGENGMELVNFRGGEQVFNASDTRSLMSTSQLSSQTSTPAITIVNNRRDIGVSDLNHVLAMARLAS